jgi:hypothetical protein
MLNTNANVEYTQYQEYSDLIREKDWLTSSEAVSYIRRNCPRCKPWLAPYHNYSYLYKAAKDGRIVSCKTWTAGGTAVRFYSKESIDHMENYYSMEPKEYAIYKCKRDMASARDRIKEDRELVKHYKLELARVKGLAEDDDGLIDWEYKYNRH